MKISIITATFNSAATVRDTLDSILRQTHQDWELIIEDGLSRDDTLSIVREYEPQCQGRMRIFSEKDEGLYDAMNRGIARATGDVIGILNSDDFYHDEHVLEDINSAMDGQPVDCVYGDLKFVQAYNTDRVVRIWKGSQHKNGAFLQEVKKQENNTERKYKSALFVGHVVPTKGVVELVEGCSKVSGLSLRIVGKCSDEMKEKLCSLAKERGNGNWLSVVGEIPHTEVIGEMLRADAFVFPSYTEAFPNVILEAMACGCAIVASDVGAIPEMLDYKGASAGICFIPNSVDEVTKAVNTLYQDNDYRIQLSEMAKDKVLNTYTTNKVWLQLVRTWDSVNKHNLP